MTVVHWSDGNISVSGWLLLGGWNENTLFGGGRGAADASL